jgi:hypothetical protein
MLPGCYLSSFCNRTNQRRGTAGGGGELGYVMRLGRFSSLVVTYHHSGTERTNDVALLESGETFSELVIMTTEGGN